MDKLSGLASKLGGGSGSDNSGSTQSSSGQEDYLDKGEIHMDEWRGEFDELTLLQALDSVESKFGGGKIDPAKMRSTNEKITDGAREQFEKATG